MKWRFFRHLHGGNDPDAERVYRWHIEERSGARMRLGLTTDKWKRTVDDYVAAAQELYGSMDEYGFVATFPVPIDPGGELLDGSHRVACALALNIEAVPVVRLTKQIWAPPWNWAWFVEHTMSRSDLDRLRDDWIFLQQ